VKDASGPEGVETVEGTGLGGEGVVRGGASNGARNNHWVFLHETLYTCVSWDMNDLMRRARCSSDLLLCDIGQSSSLHTSRAHP
jgi:hypothetical protein